MQEAKVLSYKQINRDLLGNIFKSSNRYWLIVGVLTIVVLGAFSAAGYMINRGLWVTGLNRPIFWGFMITNFVFWIGISHAGVMLSAILRLSKAEWRRPATRAAEVLTIFSLMTAVTMPIIHTGRPWRTLYWAFPFDFQRGIWPDVRSALVWDPSAINTYLTSSIMFVFVALIPDLAPRELATILPLLVLSLVLGLFPRLLLDRVEPSVGALVRHVESRTGYREPVIPRPVVPEEPVERAEEGGEAE